MSFELRQPKSETQDFYEILGVFYNASDNEIKRLAKLVELSRLVKDRDRSSKKSARITPEILEKAIEKYIDLKQSDNPNVAQEAKNAIADIKWSEATLPKK